VFIIAINPASSVIWTGLLASGSFGAGGGANVYGVVSLLLLSAAGSCSQLTQRAKNREQRAKAAAKRREILLRLRDEVPMRDAFCLLVRSELPARFRVVIFVVILVSYKKQIGYVPRSHIERKLKASLTPPIKNKLVMYPVLILNGSQKRH
jgi:hypothetical protein